MSSRAHVVRGSPERESPVNLRIVRWAVLTIFFINGTASATWVAHIPLIQEKFGLSVGDLGLVLLATAVGGMFALSFLGSAVARFGSRLVIRIATLTYCTILPLLIIAPTVPLLVAALFIFGMANSGMNISMNAQGVAVETRYGRPILSTFHALFSFGGLIGAALSGLLLAKGVDASIQVVGMALILGLVAIVALRPLLPPSIDRPPVSNDQPPSRAVIRLSSAVIGLGSLAFFTLIGEATMINWSTVYMSSTLGTNAALAAAGYASFSLMMAIGRFGGDTIRGRWHASQVFRASAALAALGLGAALVTSYPLLAIIGFGCVGLGLANTIPLLFSAAGKIPGMTAGAGLAAVSAAGSIGFLFAAPLVGFIAEATTLTTSLGVVVAVLALAAVLARRILGPRPA